MLVHSTYEASGGVAFQGLILDATFDDLLPLAEAKMSALWTPLVEFVIRNYFDLPVDVQVRCLRIIVRDAVKQFWPCS